MKTMMKAMAGTLLCLATVGCASTRAAESMHLTPRGDMQHPLYVGTSTSGDVVVAATYYDAVSGLAVAASDLGLKNEERMTCTRETRTGTHMPAWYCRYDKDLALQRQIVRNMFDRPMTKTNGQSGPGCTNRLF
jgi:hypothetical protein